MINRSTAPVFVALLLFPGVQTPRVTDQLRPTVHAVLPSNLGELWLVPSAEERRALSTPAYKSLADGLTEYGAGDYARALGLLGRPELARSRLADYAALYKGRSELKLSRAPAARDTFAALRKRQPAGYVALAAALGEAEAATAQGDTTAALAIYEKLAGDELTGNEDVWARLGRTALAAGDRRKAAEAFIRVRYSFPLSDAAVSVSSELESLRDVAVRPGLEADLGRAGALFGAGRYADARAAYAALRGQASKSARERIELRIAQCDYHLKRYPAALEGLSPWLDRGAHQAEARFFHASALRASGRHDEYVTRTRALVRNFPDSPWSEDALDALGTHYILINQDGEAARVFKELYDRFPAGRRAERAAWKYGWWSYKNAEYAETVRVFETASATFPRSNYRPSFLYWAARSHGKLGAGTSAESRMRLVFTDYGNSYYGRLANRQLPPHARGVVDAMPAGFVTEGSGTPELPTADLIRVLLANRLFDEAISELRFAQSAWGNSPVIEATLAWVYNQRGELRRGITLMRRAYPQFLTGGGHELPAEILQVIFPLAYWDLIRKHSAARNLDPYLVAALIAQESTFEPRARSVANAWGLMQILPSTGRRLAPALGIKRFTTTMLTDPEINVRMGTLFFSRLVQQFGGTHFALAGYNAGESRVVRWRAERPGVDQDEFIDDIPFPETQNYVKRILGTAEDYRRLYGPAAGRSVPPAGDLASHP